MTWQRSIQAAVRALKKEEASLEKQLSAVRKRIEELHEMSRSDDGAPRKRASTRRLSPAGRAAISKAAKKRWARYRSAKRAAVRKRGARS
jgi:predicted  nucleic acid-binding Zn-ribbon protein